MFIQYNTGADAGFRRRGRQPSRGAPTCDFARFSEKLYEIEKILVRRGEARRGRPLRSATAIIYYVALSIFLRKYLDIIAVSEIVTILGDLTGIPKDCFFGFSSKYFRCTMYFYVGNLFCFALRLRPLELQMHRI